MNPLKLIENFLDQVRKTRSRMLAFNGLYLLLILLGVCLLVGNAVSNFTGIARDYIIPYVLACLAPFFYILVRYFIRGAFAKFNRDNAAILTEKKHPELKNGLINSWQLGHHLKNPEADRYVSISFVRNLLQQTSERIQGIRAESIINDESVVKSRNWFLGVLLLLGVISFVLPDFWRVGYHNLITPPLNIEQAALVADEPKASISSPAETSYMIEDIR
ncbi:MAG: hypothetical protein ACE5EK_11305, partial [Nitrospinales bacterium]